MDELEITKLTVENSTGKLILELPQDLDMEEWRDIFASICMFLSFHPDTVSEYLYPKNNINEKIQD